MWGQLELRAPMQDQTLHNIEGDPNVEEDSDEEEEVIAKPNLEEEGTEVEVTLNAILVHSPPNTLKLTSSLKGKEIKILIDSGSPNSFIDPTVLQEVQIQPTLTYPLIITVANGNRTVSKHEVTQLEWECKGTYFRQTSEY